MAGGPEPDTAADLTGVLCLVGSVFAVLSRYAVKFWDPGACIKTAPSLKVGEKDPLDPAYYYPLIVCLIGVVALFVALVLLRTVTEIRLRRLAVIEAREKQE